MPRNDYTSITELPAGLLTPDQIRRFAHRYGYAHSKAQGKRVIEIACGSGSGLNYLAQSAAQVVGLDYSGGVLAQASQATDVPLVQGDAQRLPFATGHFDLVLCFEAIYYLEDYRLFLAECRRVLAPGGKVLLCQSNPDWPHFVPGRLSTYYPSVPEVATSLARAGFQAIELYGTIPISATSARQKRVNALRRWVTTSRLLPWLKPLTSLLQRLSYGKLHPLPPAIRDGWVATWQADLELTPLSLTEPDPVHRVTYAEGSL
ncbi:MAG: methyltransferase domain-containing protein [Caldilineaceae bacterium]|nr:methyltransferase domain-containing protein [Caldilineaceae bacterium]